MDYNTLERNNVSGKVFTVKVVNSILHEKFNV